MRLSEVGRAKRSLIPAALIFISSFSFAASIKKEPKPPAERRYKISDLKVERSPYEQNIRQPSKLENFLSMVAVYALFFTGNAGAVNYNSGGSGTAFKSKNR